MTKKTTTRLMTSGKRREMNKIAGRAIVITTHTLRNYAKRVVGVDEKDAIRYVKENKEGLTTQITRILNDARKLTQHENTEFNRRHTIKTKGAFLLTNGQTVFVCEEHPFQVMCTTCYPISYLKYYHYTNEKPIR